MTNDMHQTLREQVEKAELDVALAEAKARIVEANLRSMKAQIETIEVRKQLDQARAGAKAAKKT